MPQGLDNANARFGSIADEIVGTRSGGTNQASRAQEVHIARLAYIPLPATLDQASCYLFVTRDTEKPVRLKRSRAMGQAITGLVPFKRLSTALMRFLELDSDKNSPTLAWDWGRLNRGIFPSDDYVLMSSQPPPHRAFGVLYRGPHECPVFP